MLLPLLATATGLALDVGCSVMLCAGLPSSVRSRSGQRCSLCRAGDLRVLRPARRIHIRRRGRVLHNSPPPASVRPAAAPTVTALGTLGNWANGACVRLSLRGKARLLPCAASTEPESCRSPALAPHTCAVSPTFRYGAFRFAAFALAALPSARLTTYDRKDTSARPQSDANPTLIDPICRRYHRRQMTPRQILRANRPFTTVPRGSPTVSSAVRSNIIEVPYDVNTDSFSSVASAISASTLLS